MIMMTAARETNAQNSAQIGGRLRRHAKKWSNAGKLPGVPSMIDEALMDADHAFSLWRGSCPCCCMSLFALQLCVWPLLTIMAKPHAAAASFLPGWIRMQ